MEPGTKIERLNLGGIDTPLAWTKRSEAILSRHGHDVLSLIESMRKRRTGLYGLCLGIYAALPPARMPENPEDVAEWLKDGEAQVAASGALIAMIRDAYPSDPEEKKSESKP